MASPAFVACVTRSKTLSKWLASGMSIEDILADDEDLEREDILAVLAFAALVCNRNHAGSTDRHPDALRRSDLVQ